MTIKTSNLPDGQQVKAQEAPFRLDREDWNEYHLDDGTVVRLKATVLKILRVLDENGNPARTMEGDPWIIVQHKTEVATSG